MALGSRAEQNPTERFVVNKSEAGVTKDELIQRYQGQAKNFILGSDIGRMDKKLQVQRSMLIKSFLATEDFKFIANAKDKFKMAAGVARNNPHWISKSVLDDINHQAAFLVALVDELQKPEYHQ